VLEERPGRELELVGDLAPPAATTTDGCRDQR
jgi:hypothetical protein